MGRRAIPHEVKERKLDQQGGKCFYCPSFGYTVDHVLPVSLGGTDDEDNLVMACKPCNSSKNGKLPREWRADCPLPWSDEEYARRLTALGVSPEPKPGTPDSPDPDPGIGTRLFLPEYVMYDTGRGAIDAYVTLAREKDWVVDADDPVGVAVCAAYMFVHDDQYRAAQDDLEDLRGEVRLLEKMVDRLWDEARGRVRAVLDFTLP